MPLCKVILLSNNTKLYLWKITEDFNTLYKEVKLNAASLSRLETMKSESHQKGFMAVRMLLQHINHSDFDLYYDDKGKPHLKGEKYISISHSNGFSAILISNESIGLDIEQLKEKTLKIASRFMNVHHLENLSIEDKVKKATVIWGIKESIFKIKNETGISFPNDIFEEDFSWEDKKVTATLKFNNKEEIFQILFDAIEDYIFVCAFEKK